MKIETPLPWASYPTAVYSSDLTQIEKLVYIALWAYAGPSGSDCQLNKGYLASRLDMTFHRVEEILIGLESKGAIYYNTTGGYELLLIGAENKVYKKPRRSFSASSGSFVLGMSKEEWVRWWNDLRNKYQPTLPALISLNGIRWTQLSKRVDEVPGFKGEIEKQIKLPIKDMDGWKPSFPWIIKSSDRLEKFLEDHYTDKAKVKQRALAEFQIQKAKKYTDPTSPEVVITEEEKSLLMKDLYAKMNWKRTNGD